MKGSGGKRLAAPAAQGALELVRSDARAGFRLHRLEVYNWGTFHERVWALDPRGENALVTGDIGSGKSTLVDAITTLLVPPQKIDYNKAAGADKRERTLRSYVLGHYKSERADTGVGARPVALRDHNGYSVILARFFNEGLDQTVTLAQVFWLKDLEGQPARLFVLAEAALSIAEHFAGFGAEIGDLRKQLRRTPHVELHDSFPPYASAFRRKLGIENEQALELFHQTVSMKSVGNLTDFVRQHMLEPFPVEPRIEALISHFDDLNRAHEAVLKAKAQIERLTPLVADCERYDALCAEIADLRAGREALRAWFSALKKALLERRLELLDDEWRRLSGRIDALTERRGAEHGRRDELKRAIAESGGDRLQRIGDEIARLGRDLDERRRRAQQYERLATLLELRSPSDEGAFSENRRACELRREEAEASEARLQNDITESTVAFRKLREEHAELQGELASLRQRRSNIPARILAVRDELCRALEVDERELPFGGELIAVREEDRDWEGAIERLLHGFGVSLLVPDAHYAAVAAWVDRTHLGDRLVYYHVRPHHRGQDATRTAPGSLIDKLALKSDSPLYAWVASEVRRRFDYVCCTTIEQFRREPRAITRAGHIKGQNDRHEKDDRHRIDDRSRYVLGWTNEAKIAALEKQARDLETRLQALGAKVAALDEEKRRAQDRRTKLSELLFFESFRDLDWRPVATAIDALAEERRRLEATSDVLRTLGEELARLESGLEATERELREAGDARAKTEQKRDDAREALDACQALVAATPDEVKQRQFPRLDAMRREALGDQTLTVESCDNREKDMREWLQGKVDAGDLRARRLTETIVAQMQSYCRDYPLDTREVDVRVEAAGEYARMLARLSEDDLPRFEQRFKELLNENTIREVASFHSQLNRERQTIRERIDAINTSLQQINYNPGRYILLELVPTADADIREFQQDLRACTEGALAGSDDAAYSEAKFLHVKRIIERFRGREGTTELDRRWTRKVTDVRNWFAFGASERWREDGAVHEHYADSGGKSGGQKEKLAYTVLAASLAYQFGLEWGATRSRSFRFVVIDEAFGRGSDESAGYGLELFGRLNLQLLIVTPLQKIHVIEPHVAAVGFVHSEEGRLSMLRNMTVEEYRAERAARSA